MSICRMKLGPERDALRAASPPPPSLQDEADWLTAATGRPHFVSLAEKVGEDFWKRPKLIGGKQ